MGHAVKHGFQIIRFRAFGLSCHETAFGCFFVVWYTWHGYFILLISPVFIIAWNLTQCCAKKMTGK
jgi:hypothetical protein